MAPDWTIDVLSLDGATTLHSAAPFQRATVRWAIDGPGSVEVTLTPEQLAAGPWRAGRRRILVKRLGTAEWQGYHLNLQQDGPPSTGPKFSAAGLGLASVLDRRLIHRGPLRHGNYADIIGLRLINNAMTQPDGDEGFTDGTHTGTAAFRRRKYCVADNIGDKIRELAEFHDGGFDWEIDENGAYNTWAPRRGDDLTDDITLAPSDVSSWHVEEEAADVITYVTVAAHSLNAHRVRRSTWRAFEGRREDLLELTHPRNTREMDEAGHDELRARAAAQLELSVAWVEDKRPWNWRDVWLGDIITCELDDAFGGEQTLRVQEIAISFEGIHEFVEYTLVGHDRDFADELEESDAESDASLDDESFSESFGEIDSS